MLFSVDGKIADVAAQNLNAFSSIVVTPSGAEMYIADRKYISLINEDAAVYFEDKKSLEETLHVIGDRLETYINEQT